MTDELKQLAQAATPGPWWTVSIAKRNRPGIELVGVFGDSTIIHGGDGIAVADAFNDRTFAQDNANMAYIAAASPSVVLDLIAQRDALRSTLSDLFDAIERMDKAVKREPKSSPNHSDQTWQHNDWAGWRNKVLLPAMFVMRAAAITSRAALNSESARA